MVYLRRRTNSLEVVSQLLLILSVFTITSCSCDCDKQQELLQNYIDSMATVMVPVELPPASAPTKVEATVEINEDRQFYLNGTKIAVEDLEANLINFFEQEGTDELYSKQIVRLSVDKTVESGLVVDLLGIVKQNEWQVVLVTRAQ